MLLRLRRIIVDIVTYIYDDLRIRYYVLTLRIGEMMEAIDRLNESADDTPVLTFEQLCEQLPDVPAGAKFTLDGRTFVVDESAPRNGDRQLYFTDVDSPGLAKRILGQSYDTVWWHIRTTVDRFAIASPVEWQHWFKIGAYTIDPQLRCDRSGD